MKLLVVDGNSIINRAYYGIKALTTKNGEFTNAIYGFLAILRRMLDEVTPDHVAVAFDLPAPTFRHKMFDGYKAQRKGMPEELASQLQPVKDILTALGYRIVTCEGFEADDILGTLAGLCVREKAECVIATGDRDSLQLVGDGVTVRLATTQKGQPAATLYDEQAILEKYGVTPKELIDVKALMGDSSDNIPGVAGIGEKTALSLIGKYHNLDAVYDHLDELAAGVRQKLERDRETAYLSRTLARINCEAPIDLHLESYAPVSLDEGTAAALFARYEMYNLQKKWSIDPAAGSKAEKPESKAGPSVSLPPLKVYEAIGPHFPKEESFQQIAFGGMETKEPEPADRKTGEASVSELLGAGACDCILKWEAGGKPCAGVLLSKDALLFLEDEQSIQALFVHSGQLRIWSSKPFYTYALHQGETLPLVKFDGELAAYLLSPTSSGYEIPALAASYQLTPRPLVGQVPEAYAPLAEQAAVLSALMDRMEDEITEKQQENLLYEIEQPLARVLAAMETEGFALDAAALAVYGKGLDQRLALVQKEIYEQAGSTFNLNSPKQLGVVLFETLGLPAKKKTKTGYSTNADVLDSLRGQHPIVDMILENRMLSKLKSTYVDGLLKVVGRDGRVRTTFQQTETRTGRISSTEPNLQNIPIRTSEGSKLRRFFVPKPGCVLLDADYSQIELRVLAHIADDQNMLEAFRNGADIHTVTASQVFHMPPEMVTSTMRSRAKAVNFGIVYGIGAFSLSQDIGVTVSEADSYIKGYLETYSGVRRYMEETITFGRENGYVKTLFGRRRYLPELAASNKVTKAFGERVAMNTPIQGTAADIIKIAMIRVYERLRREGLQARLILQVHDELLVEAPKEEADRASAVLREEMESAMELKAPLVADTHAGNNWLDAK